MKGVELYGRVRYAVQIEGLSERAAARRFGLDPRTVNKMMKFSAHFRSALRRPHHHVWAFICDLHRNTAVEVISVFCGLRVNRPLILTPDRRPIFACRITPGGRMNHHRRHPSGEIDRHNPGMRGLRAHHVK